MKILELFAGSRSFSKVAEELGHKTYCTDIENFDGINQVCDIRDFDLDKAIKHLGGAPDIVWASPPCTYFSVASIGKHWNENHNPKTAEAVNAMQIMKTTLHIILFKIDPKYYYIENPRGKLRKLSIMNFCDYRKTVCYCQYGEKTMKPTDIWTNNYNWLPRPMCFNGNKHCHHEPAPRGSLTGIQGVESEYLRSVVPSELCKEILEVSKW